MPAIQREEDPLLRNKNGESSSMTKRIAAHFGMRTTTSHELDRIEIQIQPESFRFYAYIFFWSMSLIAILLTQFIVKKELLKGPAPGEPSCPPFQDGHGFDIETESHLQKAYGFNNICSNWDYSPSREITALIYPLFEYSLLAYLVADFVNVSIAYQKGWVSHRFWRVSQCLFPVMVLFCSWFRMIFVILAYENVRGHTAAFLGLQLVLMMVACLNVFYIAETKIEYDFLGGQRGTRMWALAYLVCAVGISAVKFYLDANVVLGFSYPKWGLVKVGSIVSGQVVDMIWMLFNAILPLFISYARKNSEQPLEITIDLQPPSYVLQRIRDEDMKSSATTA
mmetsp:Transcript_19260/g.24830  ORF Transcript_19260/g.24830 Transcript_19260/m.24830 type:complete len:338 (+) Transcript_19260:83-1096(+)